MLLRTFDRSTLTTSKPCLKYLPRLRKYILTGEWLTLSLLSNFATGFLVYVMFFICGIFCFLTLLFYFVFVYCLYHIKVGTFFFCSYFPFSESVMNKTRSKYQVKFFQVFYFLALTFSETTLQHICTKDLTSQLTVTKR